VEKEGEVRTDKMKIAKGVGEATRELERRLLIYTEEIHTERGFHAKTMMVWSRTPKIQEQRITMPEPRAAKERLEKLVANLNAMHHGRAKLPWEQ
jgi:hypothetical protein